MKKKKMNQSGDRFLPAGTVLLCPVCRMPQASTNVDIYPDKFWDFKLITPYDKNATSGISLCHDARYVTWSGLFYTESGPY